MNQQQKWLYFTLCILSLVCSLHFTLSLHFTPGRMHVQCAYSMQFFTEKIHAVHTETLPAPLNNGNAGSGMVSQSFERSSLIESGFDQVA